MNFGRAIKLCRTQRNMSQEVLAELSGTSGPSSLNEALYYGTVGRADPKLAIITPYISLGKRDIVHIGATQLEVLVLYEKTWSCYKSEELHCGRCDTCIERKEVFQLALVYDPTEYEDPTPFPDEINF